MRDPKRIEPFIDYLKALWCLYPDMRFHQLVGYISDRDDMFYVEDDKALEILLERLGRKVTEDFLTSIGKRDKV